MPNNSSADRSLVDLAKDHLGQAYRILYYDTTKQPERAVALLAFKVRLPERAHGEFLIVLNGRASDGTPMVAFMGGDDLARALMKAMRQYDDGSLKWRIDEWKLENAT